jgi:PelA/Pel-15E family pectate lyase
MFLFFRLALLLTLAAVTSSAVDAPGKWDGPGFLPVTAERVATLPAAEQAPWLAYLAESARRRALDEAQVAAELSQVGQAKLTQPAAGRGADLPLKHEGAWYRTAEARTLADHVISYQTPAGGWSKSLNFSQARAPGEDFGRETRFRGTFDNNSTVPQLRFLARVAHATGEAGTAYREAFARGLDYIFAAQFPHGGWPQIYPLSGGYHDSLTYNDNVMPNLLELLRDTASGAGPFAFVTSELRAEAGRRLERGIACVLATQIRVSGTLTAWGHQHDALTLQPCAARNYEPASLCSAESAKLAVFLISVQPRTPAITAAVEAAAAWMDQTKIMDHTWGDSDGQGRRLIPTPGAGPLWSRLYEIGTDKPIFGDRDKTIHYAIDAISRERRDGYSWFSDESVQVLRKLPTWRSQNPAGR